MLKEKSRIVAMESDAVWVESIQQSACGQCVAQNGCGQGLLARFGAQPMRLRVLLNGMSAGAYQVGDYVDIGIPEQVVVKGALFVYLLPLILMLLLVVGGHIYAVSEVHLIVLGVFGLCLGGVFVYWRNRSNCRNRKSQPVVLFQTSGD